MSPQDVRDDWILEYIRVNGSVDVTSQAFHEAYHQKFPKFQRKEKLWGAQPVPQAMRDLRRLYDQEVLDRWRVELGNVHKQDGFPSWVWVYGVPM